MSAKPRKQRVPKLKYTELRGIGWHVSYRDPRSGVPRKHRFGMVSEAQAEREYHRWVSDYLDGELPEPAKPRRKSDNSENSANGKHADIVPGSLLHVASGLLHYEQGRVRGDDEPRQKGTITNGLYKRRELHSREFLAFINERHGQRAVRTMQLADLTMDDVEQYNRRLIERGLSQSHVSQRLRFIKAIIDRAGRPEYGGQLLGWNWDSLDVLHGKPSKRRQLPTLPHVKAVLRACSARETAIVWLGVGCGFGQRDIAAIRVGQINRKNYDLRRGKTGVDRYGETPSLVWNSVSNYLKTASRKNGEPLFETRKGCPLVHGTTDSVSQWWTRLREELGSMGKSLGGFYTLRHLGATEFGSRPGCSIGDMKRWLGHAASSQVADVYMKPVSPEDRAVVEWVRSSLSSGHAQLGRKKTRK